MIKQTADGFGLKWAGKLYGTNTGNLYVAFARSVEGYSGILRLLDDSFGLVIYDVVADYDEGKLSLSGSPTSTPEGIESGKFTASGKLDQRGQIAGTWETELGTAGTFLLHPHDSTDESSTEATEAPPQLYTKRHKFKSVEVSREELTALAEKLEREFSGAKVIVTVATVTERASFLSDFKTADFSAEKAASVKLFVQIPERDGINRVVSVEFGGNENFAIAQSTDEAWAIGRIERLKDEIKPFERRYSLTSGFLGFSLPQFFLLAMLVYLPSIENLGARALYVLAVVGLISAFTNFHNTFVPNAMILLKPKRVSWISNLSIRLISWLGAILTAVLTYLLTENFTTILNWFGDTLALTN